MDEARALWNFLGGASLLAFLIGLGIAAASSETDVGSLRPVAEQGAACVDARQELAMLPFRGGFVTDARPEPEPSNEELELRCLERATGARSLPLDSSSAEARRRGAQIAIDDLLSAAMAGSMSTRATTVLWGYAEAAGRYQAEDLACELGVGFLCGVQRAAGALFLEAGDPLPSADSLERGRESFTAPLD